MYVVTMAGRLDREVKRQLIQAIAMDCREAARVAVIPIGLTGRPPGVKAFSQHLGRILPAND
jgi:hypothetical protein